MRTYRITLRQEKQGHGTFLVAAPNFEEAYIIAQALAEEAVNIPERKGRVMIDGIAGLHDIDVVKTEENEPQ
jgi:hypothetical protein